ncbi:hypothetical protein RhiJN_21469 [Ceratobasidium sp. AG-Ba]|nr:hypothetical protein RhiJN_21469 [Ceratobasidium sp. AG-Ba]
MIPDYAVRLDTLPLTPSRKIDRRKQPAPTLTDRFVKLGSNAEWTTKDESRRDTIETILGIFTSVLSAPKKLPHTVNSYDHGGTFTAPNAYYDTHSTPARASTPIHCHYHPSLCSSAGGICSNTQNRECPCPQAPTPHSSFPNLKAMVFVFPVLGGGIDMLC